MSYLSIALQRQLDLRGINHTDLARDAGISKSFISRLMSGECKEVSDQYFTAILKAFAASPQAQAEIVAARCTDVRVGPGSEHVAITLKVPHHGTDTPPPTTLEYTSHGWKFVSDGLFA